MSDGTKIEWSSERLLTMIAARHGLSGQGSRMAEEWTLFFELQSGTGARSERRMDAFAMNCWPSKGFTRVGYEVKVSRSDMLRELNDPSKRQWALDITNEFWFVTAPGIVKPEEIPEGLGLLVPRGNGLTALVRAQYREAADLTLTGVAAILRAACDYKPLRDARWKYQGRDLKVEDLDAIIAEQREYSVQRELETRAKELAGKTISGLQETCKVYAEACRAAGVEPPQFLDKIHRLARDGFGGGPDTKWRAEQWVKDNVAPGPEMKQIESALHRLEHADTAHKDAAKALTALLEQARARSAPKSAA